MKFNCAYDELVDLEKIVPNPENNNHHPQKQIERLAKIIKWQGQRSPIVISTRSGFIVKGHGRFEAIKSLGWEKAAVDYQDYESEAQEYADMTADNQIATWAEFDMQTAIEKATELNIDEDMLGILEIPTVDVDNEKELKDISDELKEEYEVVVECSDEEEQERTFTQLNEMGLKCRLLTL